MALKLASIFTDHMVLQRNKPIRVFGTGEGEVTVSFLGNTAKARAKDGRFLVLLPPAGAGGPYDMTVDLAGERVTLTDILIGEVWIAGGQSNMEQPLFRCDRGFEEAERAGNSSIRFFTVPRRFREDRVAIGWHFETRDNTDTPWEVCTPESALHFTAIGYHFARELEEHLHVPVGVVSCNWGGTPVETWIEKNYFSRLDTLKQALSDYEARTAGNAQAEIDADFDQYAAALGAFCMGEGLEALSIARENGLEVGVALPAIPWPAFACENNSQNRPGALYDTMVSRIARFSAAGVLWYQGESNSDPAGIERYPDHFRVMTDCWREEWEDADLQFYAVELAPYANGPWHGAPNDAWAYFREGQLRAADEIEGCHLASTQGIGDAYDIHPKRKREVGERLALLARKYRYGQKVAADSPRFASLEIAGNEARVSFTNGEGLVASCGPRQLYLAGADGLYYPADGAIRDGVLVVTSGAVPAPASVRYAFTSLSDGGLYNRAGLPVFPFRAGEEGGKSYIVTR